VSWYALDVRLPEAEREAAGAWLVGRTGQAIEERPDGALVAFAGDEAGARALADELRARWPAATAAPRALPAVDWTTRWRDGIASRRIGRLLLTTSWLDDAAGPGEERLVVDPEMAFGSGEHGSTRAALALLERHVRPGARVLDLGSGSGILAIAAVRLGAASAIGIEIDPEANEVADRNAARNGVADRVRFLAGDAAQLGPLAGPADLLCSNILRTVNVALLPAIRTSLAPGGLAIFSGMEEGEADLFRPALMAAGWQAMDEVTDDGWWAVAARAA